MPGRQSGGTRLLHKQVIVEEVDSGGTHELRCNRCTWTLEDKLFQLRHMPPHVKIVEEVTRVVIAGINLDMRTRLGQIALDTNPEELNPGRLYHSPKTDHSIITKLGDLLRADGNAQLMLLDGTTTYFNHGEPPAAPPPPRTNKTATVTNAVA